MALQLITNNFFKLTRTTSHSLASAAIGKQWNFASSCLPQTFVRHIDKHYRKGGGTSQPRPWYVPKKVNRGMYQEELTAGNVKFMEQVVQDRYAPEAHRMPSPLKEEPWPRNAWTAKTKRTGVLAIKIGCVPQWKKNGKKFYTTMYQVLDNHVINYTPPGHPNFESRISNKPHWKGLGVVVVGALSANPANFTHTYNSLFKKAGVPPKRKLARFLVTPDAAIQPGTPLQATHFKVGDYVDIQAKTIGHGFQGVVKRWKFKGGPASHGNTKFHRRPGSIGSGRTCSRVRKGKKMPGHMGVRMRKLKGLKIWRINTKYNIIYVQAPMTPGPTHCYTRIYDTSLLYRRQEMTKNPLSMPTYYPDEDGPIQGQGESGIPDDVCHPDLFVFNQPSIVYEESAAAASGTKKKAKAVRR